MVGRVHSFLRTLGTLHANRVAGGTPTTRDVLDLESGEPMGMMTGKRAGVMGAALAIAGALAAQSILLSPASAVPTLPAHTSGPDAETYYGSVIPDINLYRVYLNEKAGANAGMELSHSEFTAQYGHPRRLPNDAIDTEVVALINQERAVRGVPPLVEFEPQRAQAALWSNTMAATGAFLHDPQALSTGETICESNGGGETIVRGRPTAQGIVTAYMNSEGHRDILMSPMGFYVGSATVANANGYNYNTIRVVMAYKRATCPRTTPFPGHPDWGQGPGPTATPTPTGTAAPQPRATVPPSQTATPSPTRTSTPSPSATTKDRRPAKLSVRVKAKKRASLLGVNVGPDRTTRSYTVTIQRAVNGRWKVATKKRIHGKAHVRTVNVPAGRYRIVVPRQHDMKGVTSRAVRVVS